MSIEQEFADKLVQYKHIIYKVCFMYADNKDDVNDLFSRVCIQYMEVIQKLPGGKFVCHMGLPHIPEHVYLGLPKEKEV